MEWGLYGAFVPAYMTMELDEIQADGHHAATVFSEVMERRYERIDKIRNLLARNDIHLANDVELLECVDEWIRANVEGELIAGAYYLLTERRLSVSRDTVPMSYDITFLRRKSGQPWDRAMEDLEDIEDITSLPSEKWSTIASHARYLFGDVREAPEEDTIEIDTIGAQLICGRDECHLSLQLSEPDDDTDHRIYELITHVEHVTGLTAYDPQTGSPVTESDDVRRNGSEVRTVGGESPGRDNAAVGIAYGESHRPQYGPNIAASTIALKGSAISAYPL